MEIDLANTLRTYRKDAGMTQEQLAEALGVTVGAVYKWENGRSTPEISLLVEMADLFGISVDALLNYKVRSHDREQVVQRIKDMPNPQSSAADWKEVEKAIQRYPNHFEVIYHSARAYQIAGIIQKKREWSERALELMRHAILLIDQNTDEEISVLSIQVQMADIYVNLEEQEKAIALLKSNNPLQINHARIGDQLGVCNRFEEALPYLSRALVHLMVNQLTIADGYLNVYIKQKRYPEAIEVLNWVLTGIRSLQYPDCPCFLNRSEVVFLTCLADIHLQLGQKEEAVRFLRQAKQIAFRFDANPSISVNQIRFIIPEESAKAYDNFGNSAMDAIQSMLIEAENPELNALWEEISHENE